MGKIKVRTLKPLEWHEIINITGKDALMSLGSVGKCRIMNASQDQIIEVDCVYWSSDHDITWGLREVKGKPYRYLAMKCELID